MDKVTTPLRKLSSKLARRVVRLKCCQPVLMEHKNFGIRCVRNRFGKVAAVITMVGRDMTVEEEGTFTVTQTRRIYQLTNLSILDIAVSKRRSGLCRRCLLRQVLNARGDALRRLRITVYPGSLSRYRSLELIRKRLFPSRILNFWP